MTIRRAPILGIVVFLVTFAIGAAVVRQDDRSRADAARRTVTEIGLTRAGAIEKQIDRLFAASLAAGAAVDPDRPRARFDGAASEILRHYPAVASLAVSPDGAGRGHPDGALAGGTPPDRQTQLDADDEGAAPEARESRQFRLSGPLGAGRDGPVIRGYLPLWRTDGSGGERFDGFVIATARVADFVAAVDLQDLTARGYDYHLTRVAPRGRRLVVARSTELDLAAPVQLIVHPRGDEWRLSIAPRQGWQRSPAFPRGMLLAAVVALIAGLFVAELSGRPELLRREVDRRTKRLAEANRAVVKEAAQREQVERQRLHDAAHDATTRMPNRPNLLSQIQRALEETRGPAGRFAVLVLGLDRFTAVNDSHGPAAGDRLLGAIARRLEAALGADDRAARIGNDEFAVLLPGVDDEASARAAAARLQEALAPPFPVDGSDLFVTATIGITIGTDEAAGAEDLLRDAALAMRRAKSAGGSRVGVFVREMHAQAVRSVAVERDLRRALERSELRAYYQPVVSIDSGRVAGFEALVRWQHPADGLVPPAIFIPIAESTGLVVPVDRWVWREAARQIRDLQRQIPRQPPFSVSVNLSARHLSEPDDLVRHVGRILDESGLDPACFRLEITESMMMENSATAAAILARLKRLGIRILLDDFGTGYSSLSYLHELPVDVLKIDRSFIGPLARESKRAEIVRSIVALAGTLGLEVIAEGVETLEQLARLGELGCGYAQGYLFSRPVPAASLPSVIASSGQLGAVTAGAGRGAAGPPRVPASPPRVAT